MNALVKNKTKEFPLSRKYFKIFITKVIKTRRIPFHPHHRSKYLPPKKKKKKEENEKQQKGTPPPPTTIQVTKSRQTLSTHRAINIADNKRSLNQIVVPPPSPMEGYFVTLPWKRSKFRAIKPAVLVATNLTGRPLLPPLPSPPLFLHQPLLAPFLFRLPLPFNPPGARLHERISPL